MIAGKRLSRGLLHLPVQAVTAGRLHKSLQILQLSDAYSVEVEAVLALLSGTLPALEEVELAPVVQGEDRLQVWHQVWEAAWRDLAWIDCLPELEAGQPGVTAALEALVPDGVVLQGQQAAQVLQQAGVVAHDRHFDHSFKVYRAVVYRAVVPAAALVRGLSSDEVQQVL